LNKTLKKLKWSKVDATSRQLDESKYPTWMFKKKEDPMIKYLLEGEEWEE